MYFIGGFVMNKTERYIVNNKHQGFDELAYNLGIEKDEVKELWNKLELGWHLTPRTLIAFRRLDHNKYEVLHDTVVFLAPQSPLMVYKGTITDFASVPRIFRWLIDKDDQGITIPALAHDMLYQSHWTSRRVADAIFLNLMRYRRAPWWRRTFAYMAVRLGGGFPWRGKKQREVQKTQRELSKAIREYVKKSHLTENAEKV